MTQRLRVLAVGTLLALLGSVLPRAGAQDKAFSVVPQVGPLKGKTVYANSYALIVGINSYPSLPRKWWLSHAVDDARAMSDMLVRSYGFPPENITLLTDGDATQKKIRDALASFTSFTRMKKDDRVLVYFSGHGQTIKLPGDAPEMGFLVPYDADVDPNNLVNPEPYLRTCIPMRQVWEYLDASPAKHVLVLADACYSGLLAKSRALVGEDERIPDAQLQALAGERTRQVITAGRKGETAVELETLGHGAFTHHVLALLEKGAATPGEVFTSNQLYGKLFPVVGRTTSGKQTPQLSNYGETEGQFLFVTTPEQVVDAGPALPDSIARAFVRTDPPGAKIFIDGREIPDVRTPNTVAVGMGGERTKSVEIAVELNGERKSSRVALVAGRFQQLPIIQFGGRGGEVPPIVNSKATYDLSAQFSPDTNPSGPWTYGWIDPGDPTNTPSFHYFQRRITDRALMGWLGAGEDRSFKGHIQWNGTPDPFRLDTLLWRPRELSLHPGQGGEWAAVRWTAPTAGEYLVTATFSCVDSRATTDVHVFRNQSELFSGIMNGPAGARQRQTVQSLHLKKGEELFFTVGWGENRNYGGDNTGLALRIDLLP